MAHREDLKLDLPFQNSHGPFPASFFLVLVAIHLSTSPSVCGQGRGGVLLLRLTSGASFVPFYGPVAMKPLPPLSGNNKTEPKEKLPLLTLKKIVQMYVLVHGADS